MNTELTTENLVGKLDSFSHATAGTSQLVARLNPTILDDGSLNLVIDDHQVTLTPLMTAVKAIHGIGREIKDMSASALKKHADALNSGFVSQNAITSKQTSKPTAKPAPGHVLIAGEFATAQLEAALEDLRSSILLRWDSLPEKEASYASWLDCLNLSDLENDLAEILEARGPLVASAFEAEQAHEASKQQLYAAGAVTVTVVTETSYQASFEVSKPIAELLAISGFRPDLSTLKVSPDELTLLFHVEQLEPAKGGV